jgi:phage shock protein B
MPGSVVAIVIVAIVFGAIVKIVQIVTDSSRRHRETEASLNSHEWAELAALADRLTRRIETLERVLDASQPDWRGKP